MTKTFIFAGLVGAVIAIATVVFLGFSGGSGKPPKEAGLEAALAEKEREVALARQDKERAESQLRNFAKASDELISHATARETALSNALSAKQVSGDPGASEGEGAGKGGLGKLLKGMMDDPEMKQMIVSQQRMMVSQLYGPLVNKLGLTPAEGDAFKKLLVDNMVRATEMASSAMSGASKPNQAEMIKTIAEESKVMEQRVKEMLGDERYSQYLEYQQTVGERAQMATFRQEAAGAGEPVSDQQVEQLLSWMGEEKKQAAAAAGLSLPGSTQGQLPENLGDEQIEKLVSMQEQVNQNVYARASGLLSAPQLEAFARHQTNQLQMVRIGMTMARKFMGGK